jgi:glucan 1,3-beta-glucosidase
MIALGPKAADRIERHRAEWVVEDDLAWIAARGLNAVRLPVGYWLIEGDPPFQPAAHHADRCFDWAARHGLGVLLDLHGAPGSQNGWDHSGRAGQPLWHTRPEHVERTLRTLEMLAERYGSRPNLIGIELMNEPRWDVPLDALKPFYRDAYALIRAHCPADRVSVVFHDAFRLDQWADTLRPPEAENAVLDTHMYQCFTEEDRARDIHAQVERAILARRDELEKACASHPVIVGEWSLALDPKSLRGLHGFALDAAKRAYASAQLVSYERTRGWFYWSYKLEEPSDWSFRHAVERGWMPDRYGDS